MSRANPFGDLDDFAPQGETRPIAPEAIDQLAQASGFPSRKAQGTPAQSGPRAETEAGEAAPTARRPRRHLTGRNRQINIKATEKTIDRLYHIADEHGLPLGAILEMALTALEAQKGS